jgi:hypothetical protein
MEETRVTEHYEVEVNEELQLEIQGTFMVGSCQGEESPEVKASGAREISFGICGRAPFVGDVE